ncbi:MAG: NAD(P)H-hydrate epimerase [Bacteroidales bacterium]|nr:NAD(P)H-hydrate epimerase [Bacteroidales bacterium]
MKFYTSENIEVPAVSAAQMIQIDRLAMEETGPNLYQMMENAGRSLCELCIEKLGKSWDKARILVLAGTGGNGGGGICAARHLANRGADVTVCITDTVGLKEVPGWQLHILRGTTARVIDLEEPDHQGPDVILDTIIGYSLTGEPAGNSLTMIEWANRQNVPVISLDIPSGIDATTGKQAVNHIQPMATLTLALPKTGLLPQVSGELFLADIGIPAKVYQQMQLNYTSPFGKDFVVKLKTKER